MLNINKTKKELIVLVCQRCEYKWASRVQSPKQCPHCRRTGWDKTKEDYNNIKFDRCINSIMETINKHNINVDVNKICSSIQQRLSNIGIVNKNISKPINNNANIQNKTILNAIKKNDLQHTNKGEVNKNATLGNQSTDKKADSNNNTSTIEALTAEQIFDNEIFRIISLDHSDAEKHELKLQAKKKLDEVIFDAAKK